MHYKSVIRAVAHYVPERAVTNDDLAGMMETSDQWITERTGIKERHWVEEGTATSDLAVRAADQAIKKSGWAADSFDLIVAATLSPDLYFPGIGVLVQHKLGMKNVPPALDIRAQCCGLVYGLATADSFIRSGQAKRVLLVCSEVQSPVLDCTTGGREMAVLFGDGAGALVIEAVEGKERATAHNNERGVIDSLMGSDGSGAQVLMLHSPGTATPGFIRHEDIDAGRYHPSMDGRTVFKNAVVRMCEAAETILKRNDVNPDRVNLLIPHQANLRINEAVRERLSLPPERVFNNIQKYGNTTSATIPICMSEAVAAGKLKEGDLLLTAAFGAGFTWGCNLVRW